MNRTTLLAMPLSLWILATFILPAHAEGDTIKKIKDQGKLPVCMAESIPMAVRNPTTGEWSGYNIDMAKDLAATLGVKLEIVDLQIATIIPALMGGKCDILMAPIFATAARAEVVAFTEPYSSTSEKLLVRGDSKLTSLKQLDDPQITVTVPAGSGQEGDARKMWPKATVKPIVSDYSYSFLLEVAAGRADAGLAAEQEANLFIKQNPQANLKILEPQVVLNPITRSYGVRPDDWHFVNFLNVWLSTAKNKYTP